MSSNPKNATCPFVKRQGNTGCDHCDNYGRWDCECVKTTYFTFTEIVVVDGD